MREKTTMFILPDFGRDSTRAREAMVFSITAPAMHIAEQPG